MYKHVKRAAAAVITTAILAGQITGVGIMSASAESDSRKFHVENTDPSKVMWTSTMVEDVDENYGDVNPNANNKDDSGHQNPYNKPGENFTSWAYSEFLWTHSYPVGNGRMAGMVAGGINKEIIQINEDTIWDGSPYGTLYNENGEQITNISQVKDAQSITMKNQTSGSIADNWKYFRGADTNGNPAEIASADAIVGDEAFRAAYPEFANKSISNQAINVSNEHTNEAVQQRFAMESMVEAKFLGNPTRQKAYKSFVEVYLDFNQDHNRTTNYSKSLDLEKGIVMVDYDYMGTHFTRETFASYPDQTVATHIESSDELDFTAQLHSYHNQDGYYTFEKVNDNEIKLTASVYNGNKNGAVPSGVNAIRFEARMLLDGDGVFTVSEDNSSIGVKGGKEATIYVVGASNYVNYQYLDNSKPANDCEKYIANIKSKTYSEILARHTADFSEQFNASDLTIENINGVDNYNVPTEKRVRKDVDGKSAFLIGSDSSLDKAHKNGVYTTYSEGDNELAVLEFNYGKYLTISGSRDARSAEECNEGDIEIPISQPLNLTGKWNAALSASWNGKYTININTEMNYWSAQPLGLKNAEKPLIETFSDLAQSGSVTAAYQYGVFNERGDNTYQPGDPWVMHHNYDLWRGTQPIDNATAGLWPTGGIWLLDHAWQYYQFNLDKDYLAEVYPYMIGAAKFFTQFLVVDPQSGYLITAASCSPEQGGVQPGPAMDTQLVRNLYDAVLQASEILCKTEEDSALIAKIKEQLPSSYLADEKGKVAPNLIDDNGLIQEWVRGDVGFDFSKNSSSGKYTVTNPFKNNEVSYINEHTASNNSGHRHCSSLWEIYPGTHLNPYTTDENEKKIYDAYKKSVIARGSGSGQGWGVAWRISLNARALEAERASTMLEQLLTTRTSPNMFDQHPNFQIDGNYGATAGMTEMLLQSHAGNIAILPAIPSKWEKGQFKDFKARGDVNVSAKWENNKLVKAELTPAHDTTLNIVVADPENAKITDENGNAVLSQLNGAVTTFDAKADSVYTVTYTDLKDEYEYTIEKAEFTDGLLEVSVKYNGMSAKPQGGKLIAASYDANGALTATKVYDVKNSAVIPTSVTEPLSGSVKVMIWNSLEGMKPLAAAVTAPYSDPTAPTQKPGFTPQPTIDPNATPTPTPTPTPIPTEPPMPQSNSWAASADDATLKAGNYVMRNMSLLFTPTSAGKTNQTIDGKTFNYYISSSDNGTWASGTGTASGTAVKYDAKENGILTVYIADLGANKELCITKEGVKDNKANTAESAYYKAEEKTSKSLSLAVTAGNTYYAYVAGSKGRFVGAEFTPTGGDVVTSPAPDATPTPTPTVKPTSEPVEAAYVLTVDTGLEQSNTEKHEYKTIREAVAAAEAMNPSSEAERVSINVKPGTYREQVIVKAPYIMIKKADNTDGDVLMTWYYGTGSMYDSCGANGYYDPNAVDGNADGIPQSWGATLFLDKNAHDFILDGIKLENSYNQYYTQEELDDLVAVNPDTNNSMFKRGAWIKAQKEAGVSDDVINQWIQSRTNITFDGVVSSPRERACAFYSNADRVIVRNSYIYSKQDTIGINNNRIYFENSILEGTVDYICGSAQAVINNCELRWGAGPDMDGKTSDSGHLAVPSNSEGKGYVLYNCTVTGSDTAVAGNLGRPWNANAEAVFVNTRVENSKKDGKSLITDAGWSNMSSNEAAKARFGEYNTTDANGSPINITKESRAIHLLDEWSMLEYNPYEYTREITRGSNTTDDGWDPAHMSAKYEGVLQTASSTTVVIPEGTSNTVELPTAPDGYEFKWVSNSENAAVNENGTISVMRPAYGEEPINTTLILYVRKADDKTVGAKKVVPVTINPTTDAENVFELNGAASLYSAASEDVTFDIKLYKGSAVIKTESVTVPTGQTSVEFKVTGIPAGDYIAKAVTAQNGYKVTVGEEVNVMGSKGDSVNYAVEAAKLKPVTIATQDFSEAWANPVPSSNESAFTMQTVTGSASDTANIGVGNTVYKFTKAEGQTVSTKAGAYWDLKKAVEDSESTLANTDTYRFSFDMLLEKCKDSSGNGYMADEYSYFDFTTALGDGAAKANQSRFVRWGIHQGWNQMNMFNAANERINGDRSQFDKNSMMQNKWFRIVADVDLKAQTITTTLYNRDEDMAVINSKAYSICEADKFPTDLKEDLYFALYMDKNARTENRIEFYVDNISLTYMDYE